MKRNRFGMKRVMAVLLCFMLVLGSAGTPVYAGEPVQAGAEEANDTEVLVPAAETSAEEAALGEDTSEEAATGEEALEEDVSEEADLGEDFLKSLPQGRMLRRRTEPVAKRSFPKRGRILMRDPEIRLPVRQHRERPAR